jgi:glycosyltransferase involved in cell wall biosynthesis
MTCRVLHVIGGLRAGGTERQLYLLLKGMDRKEYSPQVVVWRFQEDDKYVGQIRELGIPLHYFPCTKSRVAKLSTFRRMVRQIKPEVIHSHSFYTNFAAWWAAVGTNAIAIGAVRSNFTYEMKTAGPLLSRLSARWPRHQISNNFLAAETVRSSRRPFLPARLSVIRNGVDLQTFQMVPLSTTGRVRILGVGSLLPFKRWDRLLRAASNLKKGLDFLVVIAGEGPLRESLEHQARSLGLTDRFKFIGHTDDIPALLADARFLAHTSEIEGCPNVVMEAMACGRAVVAMDAGDIPSLVEEGRTGFVVHRGDESTLIERMATLVIDRNLCRCMGEASRAKAEREFGLDHLVSETLAAYRAAGWKNLLLPNAKSMASGLSPGP